MNHLKSLNHAFIFVLLDIVAIFLQGNYFIIIEKQKLAALEWHLLTIIQLSNNEFSDETNALFEQETLLSDGTCL